jgi:hypothetical protein
VSPNRIGLKDSDLGQALEYFILKEASGKLYSKVYLEFKGEFKVLDIGTHN